jgi:phosphoribosylaminoimidazole-succinocarboxamide synthase
MVAPKKDLERSLDDYIVDETNFSGLGTLIRGKVRDSYVNGNRRIIITSDRVSCFDVVLGTILFKGQILNQMAAFWFEKSRDIVPNHLISVPDPAVSIVEECSPFMVEMVVRGYLTGSSSTSLWTHYTQGKREYCGHKLRDGMIQHQKLDEPLITPTTKAQKGEHDEPISAKQIIERGLLTSEEFDQISSMCLDLFAYGTKFAAERGLILVDTKYELGRTKDGRIVFIDEIHTPDSSRYWLTNTHEGVVAEDGSPKALDKEFLRRALIKRGYSGQGPAPVLDMGLRSQTSCHYMSIYGMVTGQIFSPNWETPIERIARNLGDCYVERSIDDV